MSKKIQIIDLFAGPGGLGEGFSNCKPDSPYEIAISVESDPDAHQTLTNRAFFRALPPRGKRLMHDYHTSGNSSDLDSIKKLFPQAWTKATTETLGQPTRLGNEVLWKRIGDGKKVLPKHRKDTENQRRISNAIAKLKSKCLASGNPLIVIGGPPCQAYSVNGRNRVNSIEGYSPDLDERYFLYREYCRVLHEATPNAFVMENVQGILSAKLAGGERIFPKILKALRCPTREVTSENGTNYRLYSFVAEPSDYDEEGFPIYLDQNNFNISANEYGVPQARKRVIILGLREDLGRMESILSKSSSGDISVSEVIGTLPPLRSAISSRNNNAPDNTIAWSTQWHEIASEIKKVSGSDQMVKAIEEAEKRARHLHSALTTGRNELTMTGSTGFSRDFEQRAKKNDSLRELRDWISSSAYGFANHSTKAHQLHDRKIYMFAAAFAKANSRSRSPSPKSADFPPQLAPAHKNWNTGHYADRFRCLEATTVAKTITSHLKKDGHAYIHYDIAQNRCISPREAARLQTFPDDYFFEGGQGSQYHQIGNAVPPFLAKQLACHLLKIFERLGIRS